MKSAGVAGEDQAPYQYFESSTEGDTDDFMASLQSEEISGGDGSVAEAVAAAADVTDKNKKGSYRPVFLSENAITLSDKVQLVVRFYGEPSQLHENYDYAHAMCYYKYATDELSCPQEALECMLSKTLIYKGSLYPLASIFRLRKFIARGWRISAGQMLKIMFQISKLDLSDSKALYEQLIGVDQAYMHQLIRALENREPGTRIDATYLASLIDQIFED